ncbi:MAG: efflux RND transporter permease subunit [Cyanobacteria bacterium J06623_4]
MQSPLPQRPRSTLAAVRERLNISRLAIRHAGVTLCCWIAIALFGLYAFSTLKYALFPDITFPVVVVSATMPDTVDSVAATTKTVPTALETESQVTIPLEAQLQSVEGLKKVVSSTFAERSRFNLRFRVGTSLPEATAAVEDKIEQLKLSSEPDFSTVDFEVIPLNLNEATVVSYALASEEMALSELATLTETEILPELEDLPGVLRVDLLGTGAIASDSSSNSSSSNSSSSNTSLSAEDAEPSLLERLQSSPTLVRFNGQSALALQIVKEGDVNTLDVARTAEDAIAQLQAEFPDVSFTLATTQADYITAATQATIDSLLGAVIIAVLVIFGFLRSWRATLITALAIPLSLLGTCIVMAMFGFNLETITLLALALVIGIIVDDAIVEVENITRHIELGASPRQAALRATQEIGLTVSASTLTIVAVFLPVALMGGTVGQFFKPFGLTVSAAVLISLLVARTLSPVLAAAWLKAQTARQPATDRQHQIFLSNGKASSNGQALQNGQALSRRKASLPASQSITWVERRYSRLLSWALRHRWAVIGVATATCIAGLALIPFIPKGFIPQLDRGEFYLNYRVPMPGGLISQAPPTASAPTELPGGLSAAPTDVQTAPSQTPPLPQDPSVLLLQQTLGYGESLEEDVLRLPEVDSVFTTVGRQGRPNEGRLYIQLKGERDRDTATVQAQLREILSANSESGNFESDNSDVITSVENVPFVETGGEKPLQVALLGEDVAILSEAVSEVKTAVEALPGFADVQISGEENTPGQIVEITRESGQRVAYLSANLAPELALGDATDQVVAIAQSIIPPDVSIDLGSDSARIGEVLGSFGRTLALAIVCMLAVLFIPFGRLLEPAVVGLCLPLSVVGALLALLITQSDFGMVSLLGLLFLLGLLDKNALLLMDYANQLRRAGMNRTEAILKTGLVRLRPILMTTASTVLGLLPIALGLGAGAELRQPMAVAIIGGLLTSTLLSLVVVPVLYSLLEDGWIKLAGKAS